MSRRNPVYDTHSNYGDDDEGNIYDQDHERSYQSGPVIRPERQYDNDFSGLEEPVMDYDVDSFEENPERYPSEDRYIPDYPPEREQPSLDYYDDQASEYQNEAESYPKRRPHEDGYEPECPPNIDRPSIDYYDGQASELQNEAKEYPKRRFHEDYSVNNYEPEHYPENQFEELDLGSLQVQADTDYYQKEMDEDREPYNNPRVSVEMDQHYIEAYETPRPRQRFRETADKFMTMKKAFRLAQKLDIMNECLADEEDESNQDDSESVDEDSPTRNKDRKCWGKNCRSKKYHAHYVPPNHEENGRRLQHQTSVNPTTGKAWEIQKKATKKIYHSWKGFISRFNIWSPSLKIIEGRYGTGVVSYFIFLRWLLFLNIIICFIVFFLIVLPQLLDPSSTSGTSAQIPTTALPETTANQLATAQGNTFFNPIELPPRWSPTISEFPDSVSEFCWKTYEEMVQNKTQDGIRSVQDLLQGTGWMEITAMFPGWYHSSVVNLLYDKTSYNLAFAYISSTLAYFLICLVMMVLYTSESVHETLMTQEGQLHKYCNLVFGGWDYCIEKEKAAKLKHQSIAQELKSSLEEKRRLHLLSQRSRKERLIVYSIRFALNILVIGILFATGYLIYIVCQKTLDFNQSEQNDSGDFRSLMIEFLPSITITVLNIILPIIFTVIAKPENYSMAFEIKITLMRTVFVRLASIGVLIWTFYVQINCAEDRNEPCGECKKGNTLCWETLVGQQLYKLVILDFVVVVGTTFLFDFPRKLIVSKCSCALTRWIGEQEFEIPKHVLDLVYSQTLCWLGTFYSPLLPIVCVLKYIFFFYLKKWTLLVNCSPSKIPYRASRSNTFFMIVLMLSFVLSVIPVGFSIAKLKPSKACGPFRQYNGTMWGPIVEAVHDSGNEGLKQALYFLVSAGFGVPLFVIICLAIYYYSTVTAAHKEMVQVLKDQLILEGKDKQFLLSRLTEVTKQQYNL